MTRENQEQGIVDSLSQRHGFSPDVIEQLVMALIVGHASQAQFTHSELGGMGQWSSGGMVMIGDMFNNQLKHRVDMLCSEIANYIRSGELSGPKLDRAYQSQGQGGGNSFYQLSSHSSSWPQHLGQPSSTGAQNNLRYAFFPASSRLAIDINGQITVYHTKDHNIGGFSQQQGGDQSLTFTSQYGLVRISELEIVSAAENSPAHEEERETPSFQNNFGATASISSKLSSLGGLGSDDIFNKIERLADLHSKGILSDDEFTAKKAELLQRL